MLQPNVDKNALSLSTLLLCLYTKQSILWKKSRFFFAPIIFIHILFFSQVYFVRYVKKFFMFVIKWTQKCCILSWHLENVHRKSTSLLKKVLSSVQDFTITTWLLTRFHEFLQMKIQLINNVMKFRWKNLRNRRLCHLRRCNQRTTFDLLFFVVYKGHNTWNLRLRGPRLLVTDRLSTLGAREDPNLLLLHKNHLCNDPPKAPKRSVLCSHQTSEVPPTKTSFFVRYEIKFFHVYRNSVIRKKRLFDNDDYHFSKNINTSMRAMS